MKALPTLHTGLPIAPCPHLDDTKYRKVKDLKLDIPSSRDENTKLRETVDPDPEPETIKGKSSINKYRIVPITHGLLDE